MDKLKEGPRLPKIRPRELVDGDILGGLDLGAQLAFLCSLNFETSGVSRASFWASTKNGGPVMGRRRRHLPGLYGPRYR